MPEPPAVKLAGRRHSRHAEIALEESEAIVARRKSHDFLEHSSERSIVLISYLPGYFLHVIFDAKAFGWSELATGLVH